MTMMRGNPDPKARPSETHRDDTARSPGGRRGALAPHRARLDSAASMRTDRSSSIRAELGIYDTKAGRGGGFAFSHPTKRAKGGRASTAATAAAAAAAAAAATPTSASSAQEPWGDGAASSASSASGAAIALSGSLRHRSGGRPSLTGEDGSSSGKQSVG